MVTTAARVTSKTGDEAFDIELLKNCMLDASVSGRAGDRIQFCEIRDQRRGTKLIFSVGPQPRQRGFELEIRLGDLQYEYQQGDHHHFATFSPPLIKRVVYHVDPRGGFVDFCYDEDASEETFGVKRRVRIFGGFFVAW